MLASGVRGLPLVLLLVLPAPLAGVRCRTSAADDSDVGTGGVGAALLPPLLLPAPLLFASSVYERLRVRASSACGGGD